VPHGDLQEPRTIEASAVFTIKIDQSRDKSGAAEQDVRLRKLWFERCHLFKSSQLGSDECFVPERRTNLGDRPGRSGPARIERDVGFGFQLVKLSCDLLHGTEQRGLMNRI